MSLKKFTFNIATILLLFVSTSGMAAETMEDAGSVLEEIVVVGSIRDSLQHSQSIKRNADSVVDAITAEDLGKFSDENIADAIQRIPGVQIQRNDNGIQGDRASIRGLGPLFVITTVNGRTPLSYGDEGVQNLRQFNLDIVPSEVVSGVVVHKTPTAEAVEGGLAGTIELKTLKPLSADGLFDNKNYFATVGVRGFYDSQTEQTGPRFNGVVGWKNDDDTFAAYLSGVWSEIDYSVDEAFTRAQERDLNLDTTGDGIADTIQEGVISHSRITFNAIRGEKIRKTVAGGLQWRPTDNLEISADAIFSKFDVTSQRPTLDFLFDYGGVFGPGAISVENNFLQTLDTSRVIGGAGMQLSILDLLLDAFSDSTILGLNAVWEGDNDLTLEADYSFSGVDFRQDLRLGIINTGINTSLDQGEITFDGTGNVPSFTFGPDALDPASYDSIGGFMRDRTGDNEQHAFKLDLGKAFSDSLTLKTGVRYSTTTAKIREANAFVLVFDDPAFEAASFTGALTDVLFPDENIGFNQFLLADYNAQLAAFPNALGVAPEDLTLDRANSFTIDEDTLALYAQLDFNGDMWGGLPYSGNFGVRAVRTKNDVSGFANQRIVDLLSNAIVSSEFVPIESSNTDWQLLPSANINIELADNMQLRLGVSQTMSRPEYTDLKPNGTADFQDPNSIIFDPTINPTAQLGNAKLKPYTSTAFDATFEYYTENDGAMYASFFYRDVSDFVLTEARSDIVLDGFGGQVFDVTQPVNVSDGNVVGFELGFNQPFTFLPEPFHGMGLLGNYTYVESSFDNPDGNPLLEFGFPGSSENNFNLIGYYETEKLGVRLAYVYRDEFFLALGGGFDRAGQPAFAEEQGQLDASVFYQLNEKIELSLTGINLTENQSRNFINEKSNFRDIVTRSRTIIFGVRLSL